VQNASRSSSSSFPEGIKNLLILNGLAFLAQVVIDGLPDLQGPLLQWFALWPAGTPDVVSTGQGMVAIPQFYPWQLVTMAFLHGGFSHILFNLYALFIFGVVVEQTLGTRRFLILYGVSVLGASLLQLATISAPYFTASGSVIPPPFPTLGASGGVMGVLAACALLFPRSEIYIIPFPVPIQMRWLALGYVALDVLGGFGATSDGVAHFAHLGGFAAGALLLQYWRGRLPIRPRARLST